MANDEVNIPNESNGDLANPLQSPEEPKSKFTLFRMLLFTAIILFIGLAVVLFLVFSKSSLNIVKLSGADNSNGSSIPPPPSTPEANTSPHSPNLGPPPQLIGPCSGINISSEKENCILQSIIRAAQFTKNENLCNSLDSESAIRECTKVVITTRVALQYKNESSLSNNPNIVPSNIFLCNQLINKEDKLFCQNKINYPQFYLP